MSSRPDGRWGQSARTRAGAGWIQMARVVETTEAVEELVAILSDAQDEKPGLVPFIRDLWRLCQDKRRPKKDGKGKVRWWSPERVPIHTNEWKRLRGGRTDHPEAKGYIVYRNWMMAHTHGRRPLLEQVERGGSKVIVDPRSGVRMTKRVVGVWRVNLPFCDGDPWGKVEARLRTVRDRESTGEDGLDRRQVAIIRKCVAAARMQRVGCHPSARSAQIVEAARMAAYHAFWSKRGSKTICPLWPDRKGVDLAVWRGAAPRRRAGDADDGTPSRRWHGRPPDLLVVVGKGDGRFAQVSRRFDRADKGGKAARIYLSVRTPTPRFAQEARLSGVRAFRVAGIARKGLPLRRPRVER